jgi:hypothetical protein
MRFFKVIVPTFNGWKTWGKQRSIAIVPPVELFWTAVCPWETAALCLYYMENEPNVK